jgi:hypothetical protein
MVILVTRCVSCNQEQSSFLFEFHFKGFLKGNKVERVKIEVPERIFTLKEDYLIAVNVLEIKKGTLVGSLLKYKKL